MTAFLFLLLTGCGVENTEALKKIKTVAVPALIADLTIGQEYIDKLEVNKQVINSVEINKNLLADLTAEEKKYLTGLLVNINNIFFKSLKLSQRSPFSVAENAKLKSDMHWYIPDNKLNFNYNKTAIKEFCRQNDCDAVARVKTQFVRTRYAEVYNLKFAHRAKVKCQVDLYDQNGQKVFAKEFWGESEKLIPAYDFFLAKLASKEDLAKYNDIRNGFTLRDSMQELYKEAAVNLQKEIERYLSVVDDIKNDKY